MTLTMYYVKAKATMLKMFIELNTLQFLLSRKTKQSNPKRLTVVCAHTYCGLFARKTDGLVLRESVPQRRQSLLARETWGGGAMSPKQAHQPALVTSVVYSQSVDRYQGSIIK